MSLGLKPARGGQSERFGVSVALFFGYYTLMRAGQTFAERGVLNPFIAMAIPDLVFAALAIWLFVRSAEDRGNEGRGPDRKSTRLNSSHFVPSRMPSSA